MAVSLSPYFSPSTLLQSNFSANSSSTSPRFLFSLPSRHCRNGQSLEFSLRHRSQTALQLNSSDAGAGIGSSSSVSEETTTNTLDSVKVVDLSGNEIPVSDLWKDRKAVVAFARHFGCVLCRKRADYLAAKKDAMDAAGVALVLIGPGSVDQVITYFLNPFYADPNHSCYEALNFVSGVGTTFTPKAGLKIIQLYMEGYRQDWKLSMESDTVNRGGWYVGGHLHSSIASLIYENLHGTFAITVLCLYGLCVHGLSIVSLPTRQKGKH
ncbi:unnamed protein product [Linum tenue]|uniref:Thioredoxin-like protein AAED1, chloroplastic n=1 Tax=Linum tenue TaxID=586396 RepID=A0AAV0PND9_9ROSI|nr:unnamed protein product [Linum tenue]